MDDIRCPACRGAKKVPKLGGMIGECNTCNGTGKIKAIDKPVPVVPLVEPVISEIKSAVANAVPVTTLKIDYDNCFMVPTGIGNDMLVQDDIKAAVKAVSTFPEEPAIKIDPKKAIYRKKTASK